MKPRALAMAAVVVSVYSGAAFANWTATGRFVYEDRDWNETGFTGTITVRPVRFADVEVYDAAKTGSKAILAKGKTAADGSFSIAVVDSSTRRVRVRVLTSTTQTSGLFVKVTNPGGSVYAGLGPEVAGHAPTVNVDFGTLTAPAFAGGEAFNIFDMGIHGADYLKAVHGSWPTSKQALTLKWAAAGGVTVSTTSGYTVTLRDTAGYDDTVILHEWAHYAMNIHSKSSNPGGTHALSDCNEDLRLAFDEGRATYLGNAVIRSSGIGPASVYVRTSGASGPGGATNWFDLEDEIQYACDGATSEVTVARSLWDIGDGASTADSSPGVEETHDRLSLPDREVWQVFSGPVKSASTVTHESFWNGWFDATIANGFLLEMRDLFGFLSIDYRPDAQEPNDTTGQAVAIFPNDPPLRLTYFADPDGDGKGQADTDLFRLDALSGTVYTVETLDLLSDANTLIEILDTNGSTVLASNDNRSTSDPSSLVTWTAPRTDTFYVRSRHATDVGIHGTYSLRVTTP
jgi:hypothetical protein